MTEVAAGLAAVVILALLVALLAGQPAAIVADRATIAATIAAQATEITTLRRAQPTQPPRPCPGYTNCYGSQR